MFKSEKTLLLILLIVLSFGSCTSDLIQNPNISPKGTFTVEGVEYDMSVGYIQNTGLDTDTTERKAYETFLFLHSDSISIQKVSNGSNELVGIGNVIRFHLYSTQGTYLDEVVYEYFNENNQTNSIGTFNWASYWLNMDFDQINSDNNGTEIIDGKVTIKRDYNNYTIVIDCTSKNGYEIKGKYEGTLRYWEMPKE